MNLEAIINQILSSRSDLKREEVLEIIQNKKSDAGKFLTDETAARITASELGVKISKKQVNLKIQVKDIVSGLNDVSLTGKVVSVYPPKTFKRRDWTQGKLASMVISDQSGTLRVVLWDNKVELVETGKIQREQTITVSHAYVRQGQDGKPELHLGDKANIKILSDATKHLAEITEECGPITVEGTIATEPVLREVTTAQNEKVEVTSFELRDKTGKLKVSAWRNIAQAVKGLTAGSKIKMKNIYAKKGYQNSMELFSRYSTVIEVLSNPEN